MTGPQNVNISDHLAIVFWTLIVPFSLLFQRNSHSEGEYFPLSGFCPIIRGKSGYLKGVSHQISFVCSLLQISASMVRSLHEESCTFTFSTVGSQGHERRCLRTLVSLHQCSLNLTQLVTVVFPAYWSTHLHVIPYIPESLQLTLGLITCKLCVSMDGRTFES